MIWIKRIIILCVVAGLIVAAWFGFRDQPPLMDVAVVATGPLRVTIVEEGRTRVIDRYVVSAPVPGYAHRLTVKVGDTVSPEQEILRLEPMRSAALDPRSRAEAEARMAAADAQLRVAEQQAGAAAADALHADKEWKRLQGLVASGAVTDEQLDAAALRARRSAALRRSTEFAVEVARFRVQEAKATARFTSGDPGEGGTELVEVQPPIGGRVLRLFHQSEGVVQAGQPILEIGDPGALEIEADVLSDDAVRLATGMVVELERWGGEAPLQGRVARIEPVGFTKISALGVEEQRVLVIVEITSPAAEWKRLGDGYRVEAVFVLWEGTDVLQVPASALFRHDDDWQVFVVEEGGAVRVRTVQVGRRNGLAAQITSGLGAGDRVVVHPDDRIADGATIREFDGEQ
ncbi:MAG: efflux RND transporter periplasmic adaptor subunit [Planctomycetota bacterium]|jgi:HlyD family secretion protein